MQQSNTPEWSQEYQRYLVVVWSPDHHRYYWNHYVEGDGWVFFNWLPESGTPQASQQSQPSNYSYQQHGQQYSQQQYSPQQYSQQQYSQQESLNFSQAQQPQSASLSRVDSAQASSSDTRRQGHPIKGTYNALSSPQDGYYEKLDPAFYVRHASFFEKGRVFAVLFTEPVGNTTTKYNPCISEVKYGEKVYSQIRRFVVVQAKREFCYAVPIFTYGGQATTKPGVYPSQHAIAYSQGTAPMLVPGEAPLEKDPICFIMNQSEQSLSPASRIYFGIHHAIQYNVKVKDIGVVHPNDVPKLIGYWASENPSTGK